MTPAPGRAANAVLLAMRVPDRFRQRLAERFDVLGPFDAPLPEAVASMPRAEAERVRAAVVYGTTDTSRAAIAGLPGLGIVCCIGSGYEGVDLDAARERGIPVTHSPGANASAVADLAVGLLLSSIRRLPRADAYVKSGEWSASGGRRMPHLLGLTGRRIGIYGLGSIGEKIARRVEAFETEVGYHGRRRRNDVRYAYHATLTDLAHWADVLMISVRAGPENRHAVDAGVLSALGPQGHVVNVSRGSVIDEQALIRALADGGIAGAGLDVYEREPEVPAELRALPNVALTPHLGGGTIEAQTAMHECVLANLDAFLAGRPVPTPVPGSGTAVPAAAA